MVAIVAPAGVSPRAQVPERTLTDAMRAVYSLRNYTAFDWISARYLKSRLTLEGRRNKLRARRAKSRKAITNSKCFAYFRRQSRERHIAIFGSPTLERYAPGGQLSDAAISDLRDTARAAGRSEDDG